MKTRIKISAHRLQSTSFNLPGCEVRKAKRSKRWSNCSLDSMPELWYSSPAEPDILAPNKEKKQKWFVQLRRSCGWRMTTAYWIWRKRRCQECEGDGWGLNNLFFIFILDPQNQFPNSNSHPLTGPLKWNLTPSIYYFLFILFISILIFVPKKKEKFLILKATIDY